MQPLVASLIGASDLGWHRAYLSALEQISSSRSISCVDYNAIKSLPQERINLLIKETVLENVETLAFQDMIKSDLVMQQRSSDMSLLYYVIKVSGNEQKIAALRHLVISDAPFAKAQWVHAVSGLAEFQEVVLLALDHLADRQSMADAYLLDSTVGAQILDQNLPITAADAVVRDAKPASGWRDIR